MDRKCWTVQVGGVTYQILLGRGGYRVEKWVPRRRYEAGGRWWGEEGGWIRCDVSGRTAAEIVRRGTAA